MISQETFDEIVKENMDEFGLEKEEAIKEAIKEFESQVNNLYFYSICPSTKCYTSIFC